MFTNNDHFANLRMNLHAIVIFEMFEYFIKLICTQYIIWITIKNYILKLIDFEIKTFGNEFNELILRIPNVFEI